MPHTDMESIDAVRLLTVDGERWRSTLRPVLAVLLASQSPVSVRQVMDLFGSHVPADESAVVEALHTDFGSWVTVDVAEGVHRYLLRNENVREVAARAPDDLGALLGEEFVELNYHFLQRLMPGERNSRPWLSLEEYVIHSLPGYAFGAKKLDELMLNPDFVQACDPASILRYATHLQDPDARKVNVALECAFSHVEDRPWWLHVWARKAMANDLAEAISERHPEWRLRTAYAVWHGLPSHTVVSTGRGTCIAAFCDESGRRLLAVQGEDMSIRAWDPITRRYVGPVIKVSGDSIRSIVAMPVSGRGDVLAVSVDASAPPEPAEVDSDEAFNGETFDDPPDDEGQDGGPFDDVLPYRLSSERHSVVHFLHTDTGKPAYPPLADFSDLVYKIGVVPTPKSPLLITGGADGHSRIWDPEQNREIGEALTGHGALMPGVGAVLLADGSYAAASVRRDGEVLLRDPSTGERLAKSFGRQTGRVVSVAFAPDGSWVAIGGEHMVRIWDPRIGRPIGDALRFLERSVCSVAPLHLPGGGFAVGVGLIDGRIQIWSVDNALLLGETQPNHDGTGFNMHEITTICSLDSPSGPIVVAVGVEQGTRVWSTVTILGNAQRAGRSAVTALAAAPTEAANPLVACAYSGGLIDIADAVTGNLLRSLDVSSGETIMSLTAGLRGDRSLVAAATERDVVLLDPSTGEIAAKHPVGSFFGHPEILMSPDAASVATAVHTYLGVLDLLAEGGPRFRHLAELPYVIEGMAFVSVSGEAAVAAVAADGTVHCFGAQTGERLNVLSSVSKERPVALCAGRLSDGRHVLVLVDVAGNIFVLDPSAETPLCEAFRTDCRTRTAAVHVYEQQLLVALGGFDGSVLLVDVEHGREAARVTAHLGSVDHMTFLDCTEGPLIVSGGGEDGTVVAWKNSL